jgi:hypothetical protein
MPIDETRDRLLRWAALTLLGVAVAFLAFYVVDAAFPGVPYLSADLIDRLRYDTRLAGYGWPGLFALLALISVSFCQPGPAARRLATTGLVIEIVFGALIAFGLLINLTDPGNIRPRDTALAEVAATFLAMVPGALFAIGGVIVAVLARDALTYWTEPDYDEWGVVGPPPMQGAPMPQGLAPSTAPPNVPVQAAPRTASEPSWPQSPVHPDDL